MEPYGNVYVTTVAIVIAASHTRKVVHTSESPTPKPIIKIGHTT
jgi:hypothetical protein